MMVPPTMLISSCSLMIIIGLHQARAYAPFSRRNINFHSHWSPPPSSSSSSIISPPPAGWRRRRDRLCSGWWSSSSSSSGRALHSRDPAASADEDEVDDEDHHELRRSGRGGGEADDRGRRTFRDVDVAGVSVSPFGFLVLLRSSISVAVSDRDDDDDDDDDEDDDDDVRGRTATTRRRGNDRDAVVAFPIFLTSPTKPPPAPSSADDSIGDDDGGGGGGGGERLPSFFSRTFADETSATSPEALTFLQLLNGVDMANELPPDALSRACAYYAFSLLEKKDEEEEEEEGGVEGEREMENKRDDDVIAEVEDELGLGRATTDDDSWRGDNDNDDDDARGDDGDRVDDAREFRDALDYVRALVTTTLPPDAGGDYIDASPSQRARAQLPRVWLRGVRLEEVCGYPGIDDDAGCGSMDGGIVVGGMPIRFVLECSVDDDGKMLEIPLYSVPSSSTMSMLSSGRRQRRLREEVEISSDILQELSQNYNIETSASFVSLALCQRYIKSSIVTATARSSYGIPTMKVSNRLLCMLEEMQRNHDMKSILCDNDATAAAATTATTRYCWILPDDGDGDRGGKSNNDVIDTIIQNNGLPLYRPLRRIQNEGTLRGEGGGGGGGGGGGTDKKPSLTFEQQAKQLQLQSAWKIAMQKEDAGALGRIRKAMEELEKEVMMMEVGEGEDEDGEGENSTLMKIRRAMMSNAEDGEDVVGLMLDLEEATMIKTDTDDDDV